MPILGIDIETYSEIDLTKSGVYAYSGSDSFEVLLLAYAFDDDPVAVVDLKCGEQLPRRVLDALTDPGIIKAAFNAAFERTCLSKHLGVFLSPLSWQCTAVQSAMLALPLSLEGVGEVLDIERKKLKEGFDLMRYFSCPCKPTKANGERLRNLPEHAPEKWQRFKAYCIRDVEAEHEIRQKLRNYPIPESEQVLYQLDQEINDRGILVDPVLVERAIACDLLYKEQTSRRAYELTGLENPNSVAQVKEWLVGHGVETESLDKKAVKSLLPDVDGEVLEMLKLRLLMAKTSVKKYEAIRRSVCLDGRVHGLFQFYGANRTGRWSGRLVQAQNLPANRIPDLPLARQLVRDGRFQDVETLYESTPTVLSELIRTAFIPKPGCRFIVADFSAIEARVIAWLSGEQWRLDVFEQGGDIYCASAAQMFGVPVEKHGINGHLRQKGKVAELACIAEGSLVLTNRGLVPIERVEADMRLWDGESWVAHEGVVFKGRKEVLEYEGLTATSDHLVWVEGQSQPIPLGFAAACDAHLVQTGDGGRAIRLGQNHRPGKTVDCKVESLLRFDRVYGMCKRSMARVSESCKRKIEGLPVLLPATASPQMAGEAFDGCQTALREPQRQGILQVWRTRSPVSICICSGSRSLGFEKLLRRAAGVRVGSHRQQRKLRAGQSTVRVAAGQSGKPKADSHPLFRSNGMALRTFDHRTNAGQGVDAGGNPTYRPDCRCRTRKELAAYRGTARVYDIRNAGPKHRFTVSGRLVHNCGYGGGVGALKAMGALEMGLQENDLSGLIQQWRSANPHITKLWWDVDAAVLTAFKEKTTTRVGNLIFQYQSGMLFITLPSGRRLCYIKPRLQENRFGRQGLTYEGVGESKKWQRIETYGPKLVENIVQGTARDLLALSMLRLRDAGFEIVMHVHDEAVLEVPLGESSVDEICRVMAIAPEWAGDLPLRADGFECEFYQKD